LHLFSKILTVGTPRILPTHATGARIIGTVHDEIILEVPDKTGNDAAVILKETMIDAGKAFLSRVPVEVEVTIGDTWAEK
jgi:DNA polymerase I-like protein with 3'-5' exonuclease and polymerase domains